MTRPVNIGIVGATGLVGGKILEILAERKLPINNLRLFASENSAGKSIEWQGGSITVENSMQSNFEGLDVVIFSAGSGISKELAPKVAESGAIVIDNSSAWRQDPEVPLVVAGVNNDALDNIPKGIVANPNCTTMVAMPVLKPLHDHATLEAMIITSLQAASGAGHRGIAELKKQINEHEPENNVFPQQLAYNVIPLRGNLVNRDTDEELKLLNESRKILGIDGLKVDATCVSVPVYNGHSLSIQARFRDAITPQQAEEILANANEVKLVDIPTPVDATGGDVTLVGRIRQSSVIGENGLSFFLTGDNVRKGAALNAVQLAELVASYI